MKLSIPNLDFALIVVLATLSSHSLAGDTNTSLSTVPEPDTRYGFLSLFDHRSAYGQGVFPEPFLVDDSDLEVNEFRVDWLHTKAGDQHSDLETVEVEKGFGLATLEIEAPYESDVDAGNKTQGFANIDLGARAPFYQYVSRGGFLDTTFGAAVEVGIPTNSPVSKNTELVPKIFNDTRLGVHFTLQSIVGFSQLYGTGDEGGLQTFEYGFVFGYTIDHKDLPIPRVQQLIPVFEIDGGTQLNKANPGANNVLGNAAIRVNTDAIGPIQPRIGLGFVFPIGDAARQDAHWGVYTSLVFEY